MNKINNVNINFEIPRKHRGPHKMPSRPQAARGMRVCEPFSIDGSSHCQALLRPRKVLFLIKPLQWCFWAIAISPQLAYIMLCPHIYIALKCCSISLFLSPRRFGNFFVPRPFGPWDISVICLTVLSNSPCNYSLVYIPDRIDFTFFRSFQKHFGLWLKQKHCISRTVQLVWTQAISVDRICSADQSYTRQTQELFLVDTRTCYNIFFIDSWEILSVKKRSLWLINLKVVTTLHMWDKQGIHRQIFNRKWISLRIVSP